VAGFVLPGDHVDVLLTRTGEIETGGSVTTALLQNVTVLASDQMINAPETNSVRGLKSVTLLVSPDEGKKLTLAQSGGTLTLMLRNKTDADMVSSTPVTWRDIQYSQEYSQAQANMFASIGNFISDVTKTGVEAMAAMNAEANRVEASRVAIEEDAANEVPAPELKSPTPLQIQTLRGTSSGLVVIQRPQ
jgi:Flp pilus assembly protein CpaB